MTQPTRIKVPRGQRIVLGRPPLDPEEIASRRAQSRAFTRVYKGGAGRFFAPVAPDLRAAHYNWSIAIEPDSGDYFIDPDPEVAFQKAKEKHPTARIMEMRLNEMGTCGRI